MYSICKQPTTDRNPVLRAAILQPPIFSNIELPDITMKTCDYEIWGLVWVWAYPRLGGMWGGGEGGGWRVLPSGCLE
jgi:hypothetical protein